MPDQLLRRGLCGILVTVYFWWKNIQGIHESSDKALRIMKITTVMVVMLIGWCLITIAQARRASAAAALAATTCT